jgi:hypothetical protein
VLLEPAARSSLVNPFDQVVRAEVKEPGGYSTQGLATGRLTSRIVPRFWIDVGWLWQEPLPSTLACLREIFAAD